MFNTFNFLFAVIWILGGIYISLLAFKVIKHKNNSAEKQEKWNQWHSKFGLIAKVCGILLVVFGVLTLLSSSFQTKKQVDKNGWTVEQKEVMAASVIKSSTVLTSINRDTANLVAKCFVEKYTQLYTFDEATAQDKMLEEQKAKFVLPLITDCFKQYGLLPKE